jgi:primosomal protein N' (replication factor Y)
MVAKGHHFPNVELVGIIDADNSLHFADYRAAERTFALVTQVSGRAGRAKGLGEVILQTYTPTHYVYKLASAYDYKNFFEHEIHTRMVTKYPPFGAIVRILVTGERDDKIKDFLQSCMEDLRKRNKDFIYLMAMKAPLGRIDDKFRYQILCRFDAAREREMIDFIDECVQNHSPKGISVFLEINPQSLS